jgi:hypothetical protein
MDRRSYKSKPQHLVTDPRSGEIKRIVHPSDTDIGSTTVEANLRIFGDISIQGSAKTIDGSTFIAGGANVTVTTSSNGQVVISAAAASGASSALSYVTIASEASLSSERVLTAGTGIIRTDGGANSTVTLAINDGVVATVSGTTFTGAIVGAANGGFTGSITRTTTGTPFITAPAGNVITVSTGSNGQIILSGSAGSSSSGAPTTAQYLTLATDATLTSERVFTPGTGINATDTGAGSAYVVSINNGVVATLTGSTFSGPISAASITGSITQTAAGLSYIVGSGSVTVTSASNNQIVIGSNAPRWITALDIDLTTATSQSILANGNITVDGVAWIVQNFTNCSSMSIGTPNGLFIVAKTSTAATLTPPSRTATCVSIPLMSYITGSGFSDNSQLSLRVSWYLLTSSFSTTNDSAFGLVDTLNNNQRHEFQFYRKAGAISTDYMRLVLGGIQKTGTDIAPQIFTHNCYQMEMPSFGADYTHYRTGVYNSGWPTKWFVRASNASAAGAWVPVYMNQLSGSFLTLGMETASNIISTANVKFGRVKIEYLSREGS